ncbi:MAG: hypothetical protein JRE38_08500 [Deltaproteobacteria bacterium]|nr:hypothetical protein [Deltaproteobacteria bacterium]MBW2692818.1 hypothetical protein [Deltaproteobacteria bacterium]
MKRINIALLSLAVLLALFTTSAHALTEMTGNTDGGAFFKIVVPDDWNGDLVIWNHGFSLSPIGPVSDLGPLAPLQLSEGYAVAASSYQQFGWALFKTKNDMQNMYSVFKANFGEPNQVYLNGASLGGIVTAQLIEKAHIGNVVGAYPICGAVAGSRNWDAGIDIRLIYDAVCANTPSAFIDGGGKGLPAPGFPTYVIPPGTSPFDNEVTMALKANACMGILTPEEFRTPQQQANLVAYLTETELPASFILTDMGFALFGLSDLIWNKAKLAGKQGMGNIGVTYDVPAIDASIERVATNPGGANRLGRNYTPSGVVGDVKIVSMHTDQDGLVIVENESEYASVVPASNLTTAIVVEAAPSHCGFTSAEVAAGWESLRGWVAGQPQPTAASVQGTCQYLEGVAGVPGPCRIDPAYVIPDMDGRIPPR